MLISTSLDERRTRHQANEPDIRLKRRNIGRKRPDIERSRDEHFRVFRVFRGEHVMKPNREGGFLIAKIHQAAGRMFAAKLKAYNISEINPAQGRILFVLWEQDGISINELAKRTSLGKSTLTSMLDRLEDAGFVRRVPSPDDRRAILIERTQKDKDLQAVYLAVSQEMNALFYRGLSEEAIDTFEQTLRQILENLTNEEM